MTPEEKKRLAHLELMADERFVPSPDDLADALRLAALEGREQATRDAKIEAYEEAAQIAEAVCPMVGDEDRDDYENLVHADHEPWEVGETLARQIRALKDSLASTT